MSKETRKLIEDFKTFKIKNNLIKKTIMNIFICKYDSPFWEECSSIFRSLNLPTRVKISGAHHSGLAYQILLDTDLENSIELSNDIINKFPIEPLIVISEVLVKMKDKPIGWWQDDDLINPGRYFNKLIEEDQTGVFIF